MNPIRYSILPGGWRTGRGEALFIVLLVLCIACAVTIQIRVAGKHRVPRGDEGPWLRCAATVGTPSFMMSTVVEHDLFPDRFPPRPEDNRSILYPLLIAAGGLMSTDLMRAGQGVNLLALCALMVVTAVAVRRRLGRGAALVSTLYLGCSPIFIVYSAQVYPDVLMALGFVVILSATPRMLQSWPRALAGGVAIGVMMHLKSTALLALAPLVVPLWRGRRTRAGWLRLCLLGGVTCAIVLPWAVRNIIHFGSPLCQFASTTLFTDSMHDVFRVGISQPNVHAYAAEKGWVFIVLVRPLIGLWRMLGEWPRFDHNLTLGILPLAGIGAWHLRRRLKHSAPLLVFAVVYGGLMAYVAYGSWVGRYLMIGYVAVYVVAGAGCRAVAMRVRASRPLLRYALWTLCAVMPLATVVYPLEFYLSPRGDERELDGYARCALRLAEQVVQQDRTVISSFASGYSYQHALLVVNRLQFNRWQDIAAVARTYRSSHALLDTLADRDLIAMAAGSRGALHLQPLARSGPFMLYELHLATDPYFPPLP